MEGGICSVEMPCCCVHALFWSQEGMAVQHCSARSALHLKQQINWIRSACFMLLQNTPGADRLWSSTYEQQQWLKLQRISITVQAVTPPPLFSFIISSHQKKLSASNVFAQLTADPSEPASAFHSQLTATQPVQEINYTKLSTLMRLWSCFWPFVFHQPKPLFLGTLKYRDLLSEHKYDKNNQHFCLFI